MSPNEFFLVAKIVFLKVSANFLKIIYSHFFATLLTNKQLFYIVNLLIKQVIAVLQRRKNEYQSGACSQLHYWNNG